jgi:hypothetical protein
MSIIIVRPAPAPSVPQEVTRAQAKIALLRAGLLDQVEAAVSAAGGEDAIWYADALTWRRDNPYVASLGADLGLSPEQVDNLFLAAGTIQA